MSPASANRTYVRIVSGRAATASSGPNGGRLTRTIFGLRRGRYLSAAGLAAVAALAAASPAARAPATQRDVEVVVALAKPSLARASATNRSLQARTTRGRRLSLRAAASVAYLRGLATSQRTVQARIQRAIPSVRVRWRYRIVLDGMAVVVPAGQVARLSSIPGVAAVYPSVTYRALLDRSPGVIGAPQVWGPGLETAGQGMKIGIIDDGVDQRHPFFDPNGYAMPPGFPKGQVAYTTAKVIVARAFPPPKPQWKYAALPFDPQFSEHGTHVAGIAAGNHGTTATGVPGRGRVTGLSGVAPKAYIGNYKVLTIPAGGGAGIDGNAPEIAAAIEAAVADGMDVINLSLGEPEIEPKRDIVVEAIDAAADAGVAATIAAGNDANLGRGTVISPGSAPKAITAAALTKGGFVADFSSTGPTPISLLLKPDVGAPGVSITSSVPERQGTWDTFSGTSMAAPHLAGAVAVLLQRHPQWTVAQVKSALVQTAVTAYEAVGQEAPTTEAGGGLVNLPRADNPLLFAAPTNVSFGLVRARQRAARTVELTDAGGGAGVWAVSIKQLSLSARVGLSVPSTVSVPGRLTVTAAIAAAAPERDLTGFVVLSRSGQTRRVPYWLRVERPALASERHPLLRRPGIYSGNTAGKPSRVSAYRYPDNPAGAGVRTRLLGPEQVFRFVLRRPVANFGVAALSRGPGVDVEPRVVVAGNENRLTGYAGLPLDLNPYRDNWLQPRAVAGAIRPLPGAYDIVFDTRSRRRAGRFTFRFWIDDTAPPSVRLLSATVKRGEPLRLSIVDRGSGVDPVSLSASVDGGRRRVRWAPGRASVAAGKLAPGRHTLVFSASDYQETKNMENVLPILPNTRVLRTTFVVR